MTPSADEIVEHVVLPDDNATRTVSVVHPDSLDAEHFSVGSAGDTCTILVGGEATGGRYCLIDMYVPGGSGPRAVEFSTDTDEFEGEVEVESGAVAGVFDVVDA
jgi:hypothetical protein